MENLKIEYVPIDSVEPYAKNAKLHPAEQIEQIKKSIRDYGFRDPVGVWKGQIVEGHGRVIAARELGLTEIPIIRLDDMTDEQRREYALVHNQTTMNSGFDFSILDGELEDLPDFDAEFYGFELNDITIDDYGTEFSLPDGDKPEICQMTFTLHQEQKSLIQYAMSLVEGNVRETFGNTNKNGNAIYEVVKQWAEQRK